MRYVKFLLPMAGLALLSACSGSHSLNIGTGGNSASGANGAIKRVAFQQTSTAVSTSAETTSTYRPEKLIALTFDDGPRPYVLFGNKGEHPTQGLADILDQNGVKATFFVVGWRLTPRTWGEPKHEDNIGLTCLDAAQQLIRRGHELEDHTYSHLELRTAEKKNGEQWVMHDVDRGAEAIKAVTGSQPRYLRPPDWIIPDDARRELQQQGYHVLTISSQNPMAMRDVNSLDYLCAGKNPQGCPKPSLPDGVLKQIEQREKKGTYTHILAFHELSSTAAIMPRLISDLKARGYKFVTLTEYMKLVNAKPVEPMKQAAVTNAASGVVSR
jgi:peptidoglycan/xylan/chitin deacetylase (PgdA/CDA1 family)